MNEEHTTAVVQHYLDELAGDSPAEPVVRALLDRAVRRLHQLCATLLYRSYPRLTRPPLNLQSDEMLGAVVERLLKALREARPATVRQFFALAGQHMRWELNDLARRLDEQPRAVELQDGLVPAPAGSDSGLTPDGRRMIEAIDGLPEDEREAFDLVRIQGMTQAEAAEVLGVSPKTVKRRLDRGLRLLTERLGDLGPAGPGPTRPEPGPAARRCRNDGRDIMPDDPRVQQLLDELLDSQATPEEVCGSCPELLPAGPRPLAADVPGAGRARRPVPAHVRGGREPPPPDATRPAGHPGLRGRGGARPWAAWASSSGPGTCGSTASSPSRWCWPARTRGRASGSGSSGRRRRSRRCGTRTSCRSTTSATRTAGRTSRWSTSRGAAWPRGWPARRCRPARPPSCWRPWPGPCRRPTRPASSTAT